MKSKTTLLVVYLMFTFLNINAQATSYNYVCPTPNSKFINPEQTIILKTGLEFDKKTLDANDFIVTGTISGNHSFNVKLMDDRKTLILVPDRKFNYGETVNVTVKSNIKTLNGYIINGITFHFIIKLADNMPLLKEYYRMQAEEANSTPHIPANSQYANNSVRDNNLPEDYPSPDMINYSETDKRHLFYTLSPRAGAPQFSNYLSINDEFGTPLFFRKTQSNTLYFHVMENGQLAYSKNEQGNPENERYFFMDSSYVVLDSIKTGNGYNMDGHDILLMDNDHYLLMSYDPQTVDMSEIILGGSPNATVVGLVIQEVDLNENVYFQWRSWDHFQITDATDDINLLSNYIDYVHGNAYAFDTDGNLLLSSRHLDEITKIDFTTGDIIYRFGKLAKNNQFTIQNDVYGFSHQHDVRLLPNGNITIYDNGNLHQPSFSRALEYSINEANMTAELVWHYRNDPDIYGSATGSYRRDASGNHLIGWGSAWPVAATELHPDNTKAYEAYLPTGVYSYRVINHTWKTNLFKSLDNIDLGNFVGDGEPKKMILPIHNNSDKQIRVSSFYLHNQEFDLDNQLPVVLFSGDIANIIVDFLPPDTGTYSDRLTLNYDRFSLTGSERIAIQVDLSGRWNPELPTVSFNPEFNAENIDPRVSISANFSEPIVKSNGEIIQDSDIPDLFSFKIHNQWGQEVPFTGSISADNMTITLYPNEYLAEFESYYVEFKESVAEDYDGNHMYYPEATFFTTGTIVGNGENINSKKVNVYPSPFSDNLFIDFPGDSKYAIKVYNLLGNCVIEANDVERKIKLDTHDFPSGVYLITTVDKNGNSNSFKMIKN